MVPPNDQEPIDDDVERQRCGQRRADVGRDTLGARADKLVERFGQTLLQRLEDGVSGHDESSYCDGVPGDAAPMVSTRRRQSSSLRCFTTSS